MTRENHSSHATNSEAERAVSDETYRPRLVNNVIQMQINTTQDIPVSKVLDAARDAEEVLVIASTENRLTFYSSTGDSYKLLWMAEQFKAKLLQGD